MQRHAQAMGLSCLLLAAVSCTYQVIEAPPPTEVSGAAWSTLDAAYLPGTTVVATLALYQTGNTAASDVSVLIGSTVTASDANSTTFITQLDDVSDAQGHVHVLLTASGNANITLSASLFAQNTNTWLTNAAPPLMVVFNTQAANANNGTGAGTPLHVTLTTPSSAVTGTAAALVVAFTDANNVPAPFTGTLHFTSSDGAATLPADANVVAQPIVTYKSGVTFHTVNGTPPTTQTVQVTARETSGTVLTGTASVSVTPAGNYFTVVASPNTVSVASPTSLTITLYNQNGTVAAAPTNAAITVTAPHDPMATLSSAVTMTSNPYTWANAIAFQAAGTQAAVVANADNSIQGSAAVNVTAGGVAALSFVASASAQAGAARTVAVQAVDMYGNVVNTYTSNVTFSFAVASGATDPNASISPVTVTAQQGVAQTTVICAKIPSCTVVANSNNLSASTTLPVTAANPAHLIVAGNSNLTAGVQSTVTVSATDTYGNAVSNFTGGLTLTLGNQTMQQSSSVSNGNVTISYLPTVAGGNVNLTIVDSADGISSMTFVNVAPGVSVKAVASCPSCPLKAGQNGNFVVSVTDTWGNVTPNFTGTINLSTTDTTAGFTFSANPNHTYTTTDVGSHTFTIALGHAGQDTVNGSGAFTFSTQVTVTPGDYATMGLTLSPVPQVAGQNANLTMTAVDAYGNLKTDYTGAGTFTCTDAAATVPAQWSFAASSQGVLTVSGFTFATHSSTYQLVVRDNLHNPNILLNVIPGPPVALTLMNWPSTVLPNAAFTFNAASIDSMGNTAAWNGNITFSSTDLAATLPATFDATTSDGGYHTFVATLRTLGNQNVTLADAANVLLKDTESVAVQSGQPAQLVVTTASGGNANACAPVALTVTVEDASSNVVTNANFAISITASTTSGTAMQGNTTAKPVNGVATFAVYFTNQDAAANYTIVANGNGLSGISVVSVSPSNPVVSVMSAAQESNGCVAITYNVQGACDYAVNFAVAPGTAPTSNAYFMPAAVPGTPFGDTHVSFLDGNVTFKWNAPHDLPHYAGAVTLNFGDAQTYALNIDNTTHLGSPTSTPIAGTVTAATLLENYSKGVDYVAYATSGSIVFQPISSANQVSTPVTNSVTGTVTGMAAGNLNHDGNNFLVACLNGNAIQSWSINPSTLVLTPVFTLSASNCLGVGLVDVNRDNRMDVVTADGNNMVVLLQTGAAGSFGTPQRYSTAGGNVLNYRAGNVRHNGTIDVVAVTDAPALVTFMNDGNGVFSNTVSNTLSATYFEIGLGDFDRDGSLDVVLDTGAGNAAWLRGMGTGGFYTTNLNATATAGTVYGVVDLNKDGAPDVLSYSSTQMAVTYGTGTGLQTALTTLATGNYVRMGSWDIDRNGFPDVVAITGASGGTSQLNSYKQSLPSICSNGVEGVVGSPLNSSADQQGVPGDFNGDSKMDMVYVSPPYLHFYAGDGADGFQSNALNANLAISTSVDIAPAAGDINGDGHLDIAVMEGGGPANYSIGLYLGAGNGNFAYLRSIPVASQNLSFTNMTLTDINQDGAMDLVVGDQNTSDKGGAVSIFASVANSNTEVRAQVGNFTPLAQIIVDYDMNGDGKPDVVTLSPSEPNAVHVFMAASSGVGVVDTLSFAPGAQAVAVGQMASGSFYNYQVLTVAALPADTLSVYYFGTTGASSIVSVGSPGSLDRGCVPSKAKIHDFDGMNYGDLAVLCQQQGRVAVLYNSAGSPNFTLAHQTDIPALYGATQLFVADFDTDGVVDVATSQEANGFAAARNKWNPWPSPMVGVGFVGSDADSAPTAEPNTTNLGLALANFNNDGYIDLAYVAVNASMANTHLVPGNGNPQWQLASNPNPGPQIGTTTGPFALVAGDLNRDGITDVVMAGNNEEVILYGGIYATQTLGQSNVAHLALGDINNDGWPDIVMADNSNNGTVAVFLGTTNNLYPTSPNATITVGHLVNALTVGSVTPDTRDSILVDVGTSFGVYGWNLTSGTLQLNATVSYPAGAGTALSLRVVDVDRDGFNDVVVEMQASGVSRTINRYTNAGTAAPTFQTPATMLTVAASTSSANAAIADFDSDGYLDIMVPTLGSAIVLGSNAPSNWPLRYYVEAPQAAAFAAGDINRDGITDLTVLATPLVNTMSLTHHVATLLGR